MTTLTPQAERALERYLKRVRLSLRGTSVDAPEVERDVREHIHEALGARPDPVTDTDLGEILNRLGSPTQWVPDEEAPMWRQVLGRLQHGPEDWRLAYLAFGLFFLGLALWFIAPLFWIPAYFIARAAVSLAAAEEEPLGPRKWLVYPPLVLVSAAILALLLFGPLVPFVVWGLEESAFDRLFVDAGDQPQVFWDVAVQSALFGIAIGVWWVILAPLSAMARRPLAALLVPLADGYQRKHAVWLGLLGLALTAVSLAFLFLI